MLTVVLIIVLVILIVPLFYWVHLGLGRVYSAHLERFCKKRGLKVTRYRHTRCSEYVLFELDCLDQEQRRLLVRLLVWVFGIHEVLSIEDFSDERPSPTPEETEALITRGEFRSRSEACTREEQRQGLRKLAISLVFLCANLPLLFHMDKAQPPMIVQVSYGTFIIVSFLWLFFLWPARGRKQREKRYGLACPACGKSLSVNLDCERLVADTGRCWHCNAWVLTAPLTPRDSTDRPKRSITLPVRYDYNPPWWSMLFVTALAILIPCLFKPPQQNSWVNSGSGRFPSV